MPSSKKRSTVKGLGLLLGFAVFMLAAILSGFMNFREREMSFWARHALRVESRLYQLQSSLQRAESDERGYILTRDERYLRSLDKFSRSFAEELTSIAVLVSDNPAQSASVAELRSMIQERVEILKSKSALVKADHAEEAIALVRSGRGNELMNRLARTVGAMTEEEEGLYQKRVESHDVALMTLQLTLLVMAATFIFVFIVTINDMQEHIVDLEKSSDSLTTAYNQLLEQSTLREVVEAQLRQSQKLDALGELAGGIAHDFNNMIGVIVASLHVLRRKLQRNDDEERGKLIDSALKGAENATKLVRKLLAVSRVRPLEPRRIDLNEFLPSVAKILRSSLGEGIKLETKTGEGPCFAEVDPDELENAIVNLAVNSRDAMPNGGRLKIESEHCYFDEGYAARNPDAKAGHHMMLAVSDTGCGISPDLLDHVFEPFFTTKPLEKGTGLGLTQALSFVKRSGGHIRISSQPNVGTTVRLYLPCVSANAARPTASAAPAALSSTLEKTECPSGDPTETILVVDDDDITRKVTVAGVRELGYTALEADSGEAALSLLAGQQSVTMMITDVMMPAIDGLQLAEEATKIRPELEVLYVSGYPISALLQGGLPIAGADLLQKPFSLAQIALKIRGVIDRHRARLAPAQYSTLLHESVQSR